MASCYSPSVTTAWASVAYLQDQMALGWFIRGLHSAGASAMIILLLLHMLQVAVWGAYRAPRELNWIVGVALLGIALGFALTGYLLPWDQKGYWATQVATSLMGAAPLLGPVMQQLIQGGTSYGHLTLTRFYALHVFVLPATTVLLVAIHIALFRRHGVTPSWRLSPDELERKRVPFWPDQLVLDAAAIALIFSLLAGSVIHTHGAALEAPADPTAAYDARPEWYFLPLFQLLKLFPGRAEIPAALGAPALIFGLLLALPFLDRAGSRSPQGRWRYLAVLLVLIVGAAALGLCAWHADAHSETYQKEHHRAEAEAERARRLALEGVPVAGGRAVFENDPTFRARRLLAERCLGCHIYSGTGEERGPSLDGWSSRAYLTALLHNPDHFYGHTPFHEMKPVTAPEPQIAALVEYVYSLGGGSVDRAQVAEGQALFSSLDCDQCHETDGSSSGQGPNLGDRASRDWLRAFLRDPSAERFFGKKNEMPKVGEKLSPEELESVVDLLLSERAKGLF